MSQLSHAQFPLRRHPDLLVDHRRARSAAVAEPRGANVESRDRLRWPASFRNGGRNQIGTVADIKSESGGLCEVAGARVGRREWRPHISRIERRRGPVSCYGESAGAVLILNAKACVLNAKACVRRRRRAIVERFEPSGASVWAARAAATTTRSRPKRAEGDRTTR